MPGALAQAIDLLRRQLAHGLGRAADDHAAVRKFLAFGHQRTSAYQTVFADFCAIQNDGTNANEGLITNGAAMQHHFVANGHIATHDQRLAEVGMQHAGILDIAACPHRDAFGVTP